MGDGHTKEGSWPVTLKLTADQVEMLIRAIRVALMISGSGKNIRGDPKNAIDIEIFRKFLKEIIEEMEAALGEQHP